MVSAGALPTPRAPLPEAPRPPLRVTVLSYVDPDEGGHVDPVVPAVVRALEANGHAVSVLSVHDSIHRLIRGLRRSKPGLVFNLLEQFGDRPIGSDIGIVGVLDLLCVPYTGGGPGEFYLTGDKSLAKKVLAYEGIDFPKFAVFAKDASLETGGKLRMPLFVKPLRMDASIGIECDKALVRNAMELFQRVADIHAKIGDSALAEEYIEGREIYVGVLGNQDPTAFPPIEIDFSGFPEGKPKVMDTKAKFDESSPEYKGSRARVADMPEELAARVKKVAIEAYRALRVRDYGRVDIRLTDTGEIYVIEVNASCYLEENGEFAMGARAAGLSYPELVQRIVDLALERHRIERTPSKSVQIRSA